MEYTQKHDTTCPIDRTKVLHTVTFQKSTCSRFEDSVAHFLCSRNSSCKKCTDMYR